jgi:hypothetical protein
MKVSSTCVAAMLWAIPSCAAAAQPVCLSRSEATSLVAYALPQAINGAAKRCSPVLPANAFLRRQGSTLASRYAVQKDKHWSAAKPAFLKTLGADGSSAASAMTSLPDQSLRQLADVFVEGFVSQRIALNSCRELDLAIDLLSPLPPENTAGLIALTMNVASSAEPKVGNISLCKN